MDKPKETTEEKAGTSPELSETELDQVAGGAIAEPTPNLSAPRLVIKVPPKKPGAESLCSNCG